MPSETDPKIAEMLDTMHFEGFENPEDVEAIKESFKHIYENSPSSREILDIIAEEGLTFNYNEGGIGTDGPSNTIYFDPALIGKINAIDENGTAFVLPEEYILMHEAIHALKDTDDIGTSNEYRKTVEDGQYYYGDYDYLGDTERLNQPIQRELGNDQTFVSYAGSGMSEDLPSGVNFTGGNKVDVAIAERGKIYTDNNPGNTSDLLIDRGKLGDKNDGRGDLRSGGGDDYLYGREGADRLDGGAGDDYVNGGRDNDTIIGGTGSDYIDGGADYDHVTYKDRYADTDKSGLTIEINGDTTRVTQDSEPGTMRPQVDTLVNVEKVTGSDRAEVFKVNELTQDMTIDGAGGADRILLRGEAAGYTVHKTGGVYPPDHPLAGEPYDGRITNGEHTLYYRNIDDDKIGSIDGPQFQNSDDAAGSGSIGLEKIADTLTQDLPRVRQDFADKSAAGTLTADDVACQDVINSPAIPVIVRTLSDNGVEQLDINGRPMGTPLERVSSVTEAAVEEMKARELPYPQAEIDAARAAQADEQHVVSSAELINIDPDYDAGIA